MSDNTDSSTPIFDKSAFQKRCVYDKELEHTILYGSMQDLRLQIDTLKQYFKEDDYHSLAQIAHALKGTSGNLSALRLYASAKQLESSAKAINEKSNSDFSRSTEAEISEERIDQLIKLTEKQFIEYNALIQTEYPPESEYQNGGKRQVR